MAGPASFAALARELLASLVAPPRCAACDVCVRRRTVFCPSCASTAERAENATGDDVASFVYGGAVATAIVRMKYASRPDLARPLADLLWRALQPRAGSLVGVVVVPVPLHPTRLAARGFNQSALLARSVARHLGAPFRPLALARVRDTPKQAALDRAARLENLAAAFRVREPDAVLERAVLLVDDVRTTGATLDACASVLRRAGARTVATAVVARTQTGR
jgi:ComF family protein